MNWRRLLAYHRHYPDPLYFVIVGTEATKIWQGYKNGTIEEPVLVSPGEEKDNEKNSDD